MLRWAPEQSQSWLSSHESGSAARTSLLKLKAVIEEKLFEKSAVQDISSTCLFDHEPFTILLISSRAV